GFDPIALSPQPGRPAGHGQAIVARDLQVPVAELVKCFTPAAVAAIEGHRPDAFFVPRFRAVEHGRRQLWCQLDAHPIDMIPEGKDYVTPFNPGSSRRGM